MNKSLKKKITITFMLMLWLVVFFSCHKDNIVDGPGTGTVYPNVDSFPSWSPDGSKIIYNHYGITKIGQDGTYGIDWDSSGLWMMNMDGSDAHLLLKGYDIYSAWSPTGGWIAYHRGGQIYKIPISDDLVDEAGVEQLTVQGENYFPAWSSDGDWIAYDTNNSSNNGMNFIWKMKSDGSKKVRLVYEPEIGEIRMPSWSPRNDRIVHQRYVEEGDPEIFTMDCLGENPYRLTYDSSFDSYPHYSPDGMHIVFESDANIWVMDVDGSNLKQLTTNSGLSPSWSPDGTKIAYIGFTNPGEYDPSGNGTVWIMNADGSDKKQLTFGPSSLKKEGGDCL